jgi:hypothetical protein
MPRRFPRHAHGRLLILDEETRYALRLARREHRSRVVAWIATFAFGAIFWAAVIGWLLK